MLAVTLILELRETETERGAMKQITDKQVNFTGV
jgi:hypothetical protein